MHATLQRATGPNAFTLQQQVPSGLNIPEWRSRLRNYSDTHLCDFLEFGWPVGYRSQSFPKSSPNNHGSATHQPHIVQGYLDKEIALGALCGPFPSNPLDRPLTVSPLQVAVGRSGKPRVVIDLSFPRGSSVNDGIPRDSYLGEPFILRLPGTDALVDLIRHYGPGCLLYKKDLSRAYRQLRVDPRDYHLLGIRHNHQLYFDIAPPFGLRSAAMMCQRTTNAVTFMFHALGYSCTNYIDDFAGADSPDRAFHAFNALGELLDTLGLASSPEKDCPPSPILVFLGVHFDTIAMTMSVTSDRLTNLLSQCRSLLDKSFISCKELQSLLGVMSFVTACVRPARVFMSSLLNTFREHRQARLCPLSDDNKSDLRWWVHFVPHYNGVSLIKSDPWINDPLFLSTDACSTGAGGYFQGRYFHTIFPDHIQQQYGHDINVLELLTVMVALKLWGPSLSGQRFVIRCDNNNSVLALNSGRSRSHGMQLCLREIWFVSAQFDFEMTAEHIDGPSNSIADHLSRWHLSPTHQSEFAALTSTYSTTELHCPADLFNFHVQC